MLQRMRRYLVTYEGDRANLQDLHRQLTARLALLVICASAFAMWILLPREPFPITIFALLAVMLGIGLGARALVRSHATLARHLLIWGSALVLLAVMWLFPVAWLPFFASSLIFSSVILAPGSDLAIIALIFGTAAWWVHTGARRYPLPELIASLVLSAAIGHLVMNTLYTALQWTWNTQKRADRLLKMARDHRAELIRALKSLELANEIQRRTQRELAAARQQAEEARRMKEQFAANISHELRTPLNLILGFSELMYLSPEVYGDMPWPPTLRRDIYQVYRASRHLSEMIDDILDLSRFEMVGFTLNREPTPLTPLLEGAVEIARDLFRGRPVRLEVDISPDLPTVDVDRTRIRQVLLNLLTNAQRFTEEGVVRVEARQTDGEVIVSVSDTGPGIPADKLPYIFDEFYQVDHSMRRAHGGAGLGLAICKRFVQAHEGRIWVESREGVGSTFFFSLPIPGRYLPASHLHVEQPVEPPWPAPRPCILVLDPDPTVAAMIRRHVEGYDVLPVEEEDRLIDAVMLHHPRAVVCNVPPGVQDGQRYAIPIPVPVIECSLPSQAWISRELSVAACLSKPVTEQRLMEELRRIGDVHDVLIVDDDRGFCQLVTRILNAKGHGIHVRHAYDGEEGLQAMRAQRPDVVLLDLIMPGMDGFEMLEEMQRDPWLAEVPVVLLTATTYTEDALARQGSRLTVHRADGLRPAEVLRCLKALVNVLEPRYDERSVPEEMGNKV